MSKIAQTGFVRFALYFPGEKKTIETGRTLEGGEKETREVTKSKTLYGDWCGGSLTCLPFKGNVLRACNLV